MRKLALLAVILVLSSGCGRGWLPMFRGAPCNSGVCGALPASYDNNCAPCGTAANYGQHNGEISGGDIYSGDSTYYGGAVDGGVVTEGYSSQGTIVSPSMAPIQSSGN